MTTRPMPASLQSAVSRDLMLSQHKKQQMEDLKNTTEFGCLCTQTGCCQQEGVGCVAIESACNRLASPESEILEQFPAIPDLDGEFEVTLDKSSGTPLGIDIVYWESNTLLVEGVVGGLVQDWNRRYPRFGIRSGDLVVEVNGVRGDMHRLVDECTKKSVLKMTLRRGPLTSAAKPAGQQNPGP